MKHHRMCAHWITSAKDGIGECNCDASVPEASVLEAERLALIAVRGALKDAFLHGYRDGMKRGQEMAAWGYMTPAGIAAAAERSEQKGGRANA